MSNYFDQGIEHIVNRIMKCEHEIAELSRNNECLMNRKAELEQQIKKMDSYYGNLTCIYELLRGISKFHERNYLILKEIFEVKLKKVNVEYTNEKKELLNKNNTFLSESDITRNYIKNRDLIIKDLTNSLSGKISEVDALLSCLDNINDIDPNYYLKMTKSERLIKILVCYIYINLILWDPFSKNQFELSEFIKNYNCLCTNDDLNNIYVVDDLFNWICLLNKSNNIKQNNLFDIKNKINTMYINEYVFEIISNYWYPIHVFETDNLIHSIIYFKNNLNLIIDKYKPEMINKYYYFLDTIRSNYYKKNIYNEYQFIYHLLNWSFSFHIFINKFEIEDNLKDQLIKKTSNIMLEFTQLDNKDTDKQDLINLFTKIQVNIDKLINLFSNIEKLKFSSIALEEVIKYEKVVIKLNAINMNYIFGTIYHNFINYNIHYGNSYYSIYDIILNLMQQKGK
ncbi:hypothetical protein FG379_002828 [Cryptosporidium bovis]|uniref:uncharacterized protein n=1 Tax=Cryptosporidium bovis TaxID=310047 RepID=UPI00351A3F9A|nr:hypothetical protein FG379_002828 [Cryptosporidium bovis]